MAAFASRRNRSQQQEVTIDALQDAIAGDQLIVVFVYCDSSERRCAQMLAASKRFEATVLGSYDVATALQGCKTIRINGQELDRDVRKAYKLSSQCPQLVLMDVNGKKLYRATASTNPETLAKMINAAKERVQDQVSAR